jgi:cob(I)alamin adenosyltransferase
MAKIYTKTGDEGMTSLVGGSRVRKDCARLEAYGTVDELNSCLGLLLVAVQDEHEREVLVECQNVLFCMGAVLATEDDAVRGTLQSVEQQDIEAIERAVDEWQKVLPAWKGFVLPGGVEAAARAQVCRTVCRRTERRVLALAAEANVPSEVLKYLNRLSDLLFVLALRENFLAGKSEIFWQKRR